jgi:hypothetical protein
MSSNRRTCDNPFYWRHGHVRTKKSALGLSLFAAIATLGVTNAVSAQQSVPVLHKTVKVGDLDIFYREAGPKDAPTILLLHGFPTSSQMFRNLPGRPGPRPVPA